MPSFYSTHWFTTARTIAIGALAAVIFFAGESRLSLLEPSLLLTALVAAFVGVSVGFVLLRRWRILDLLSKIGAHHYSLAGAVGFVLLALWAFEGGSLWPLAIWFFPAGVLESIVSSLARPSANAS